MICRLCSDFSWLNGKESACQHRRFKKMRVGSLGLEIPWRRKWKPTPALLPGKSHGQRSLEGYSPWGRKESDTTEHAHTDAKAQVKCYLSISTQVLKVHNSLSWQLNLRNQSCFLITQRKQQQLALSQSTSPSCRILNLYDCYYINAHKLDNLIKFKSNLEY